MTSSPATEDAGDLCLTMRRHWIDCYLARQVGDWPSGLATLDIGGCRTQKRGNFNLDRFPQRTVSVNLSSAKSPHVCADAAQMPFASGSFDAAICAETLEHVYDPRRVVCEIARVMRPDSRVLFTIPFMVGMHPDPEDYGRYTPRYWTRLLVDCGFDLVGIEEHGRLGSVVLDIARSWLMTKRSTGAGPRPLLRVVELALRVCRRRVAISEAHREPGPPPDSPYTRGYGISARRLGGSTRLSLR